MSDLRTLGDPRCATNQLPKLPKALGPNTFASKQQLADRALKEKRRAVILAHFGLTELDIEGLRKIHIARWHYGTGILFGPDKQLTCEITEQQAQRETALGYV